jgi:hypothetical protein
MKTLTLAVAIALCLATPVAVLAQANAKSASPAAAKAVPAWVARSNENTQVLILAQAPFQPESVSFFGIPGYDDKVFDFGPNYAQRFRDATAKAKAELLARSAKETDANVKQDLAILVQAADDQIEASQVNQRMTRPWLDAGQTIFQGLQSLLSEQTPADRRAKAVLRLQRYVGVAPGSTPLVTLARQRYDERNEKGLVQPTQIEVQQSLDNVQTYRQGIRDLFVKYKLDGQAAAALDALDKQLTDYAAWSKAHVLPTARTDYKLPDALYALALKNYGIDIDPKVLIERAQLEFMETRNAMQQLAPLVAKEKGVAATDYVGVIRALKRQQLKDDQLEPYYRGTVMPGLDRLIAQHAVVSLPQRPMQMRLGTQAESAAQPAPHFQPAPLVGNTGQQGTFILPLGNPNAGADGPYDDFNFPASAWTLSAHAVRLQFGQRRRLGLVCRSRNGAVRAAGRAVDRVAVPPAARRARDARSDDQPRADRSRHRVQGVDRTSRLLAGDGPPGDRSVFGQFAGPGRQLLLRLLACRPIRPARPSAAASPAASPRCRRTTPRSRRPASGPPARCGRARRGRCGGRW